MRSFSIVSCIRKERQKFPLEWIFECCFIITLALNNLVVFSHLLCMCIAKSCLIYKRDQVCIIQVHTWRKTHPGFDSLHPIVVVLRCNPLIKVPFQKIFLANISSGWWIIVFLCNLLHLNIGWSCEEMRGEDWRRERGRDIKYSSITSNLRD